MIKLTAVLIFVALVSGCSTMDKIGKSLADKAVLADVAMGQASARYVQHGKTKVKQNERIVKVEKFVDEALGYLVDNPSTTSDALMIFVKKALKELGDLAPADRLLISDILKILKGAFVEDISTQKLSLASVAAFQSVLASMRSAALMYK